MSKEEERISPCPFCGGESYVEHGLSMWNTYCNNLDCDVKPTAYFETKEEAIAAWGGEGSNGSSSPEAGSYAATTWRAEPPTEPGRYWASYREDDVLVSVKWYGDDLKAVILKFDSDPLPLDHFWRWAPVLKPQPKGEAEGAA